MKKIQEIFFIIFILILLLGNNIVSADMGNKPSINIKIKNIKTNNYLIDLFEYSKDGEEFYSGGDPKNLTIWNFNEIAEQRRNHN